MPWRAIAIWLCGALFIYANMGTAEAAVAVRGCYVVDWPTSSSPNKVMYGGPSWEAVCTMVGEWMAVNPKSGHDKDNNGLIGNQFCGDSGDIWWTDGSGSTSFINFVASGGGVDWCFEPGRESSQVVQQFWPSGLPDCETAEAIDPDTGECIDEPECGPDQHVEGGECVCDNVDMAVISGQCIAQCGPYQQWNSTLERCDFECESQKGKTLSCNYPAGVTPPDSVCDIGCYAAQGGVSVILASGVRSQSFVFSGDYCGGGAGDPLLAACVGDEIVDTQDPDTVEGHLGPDDLIELNDEGGTEFSIDQDGGQGEIDERDFGAPDGESCTYSDDGVVACDDSQSAPSPDGTVENDTTGDGVPDDGFTVHNDLDGAPPGATIVDSETGESLGVAVDQDGDGVSDGIDTDGDGDIDADSPDDAGGGCDNNGDGVCDESDGDNDGDGDSGDAADCVDNPDTDENECDGTDGPGGSKVAGLPCEETVQCQPDKEDVQGQLWCAQLQLQHEVSCQYELPEGTDLGGSLFADNAADDGSEFFDEVDLSEDAPGLEEGVVSAAGGCFQDLSYDFNGQTFVIPLSSLCGAFGAAGAIILMVSYMVAGFIIYRSVF